MLTPLDYTVIAVYVIGTALFGLKAGGRQTSTSDYFLGNRNLPWWAVCFSVVATETSTLTVIGVPAVSYGGTLLFMQITFGYLLGRLVVALLFLPRYYQGNLVTAYALLSTRYGDGMRATASATFLLTRLLADGVRLFATAIPLKVIAESAGIDVSYFTIIAAIGVITIIYTLVGGIKAVVWMDVIQMTLYVGGAIVAIILLAGGLPEGWLGAAAAEGKTQIFSWGPTESFGAWATTNYTFLAAVIGGAIFSMASHGTDQLIVQRLLTCKNLADSRKALIGSGFMVMLQFALFLIVGLMLWAHYQGASLDALGLTRGDEIFPKYIIEEMPPGLSGLLLAGIIAAAMSTLSSSLNALASSTMMDLYERFASKKLGDAKGLRLSRYFTLFWGVVFIGFASLFTGQDNPVVELGLAIASFTYGGLLGVFLLGLLDRRTRETDAVIAFLFTIVAMFFVIRGVWYSAETGWTFQLILFASDASQGLSGIGWPWYTAMGALITLVVGGLLGLRHRTKVTDPFGTNGV
jgi:SSS family transporter